MNTLLNKTPEDTSLTIQGCGYRIENDRIVITIERITNDRENDNISGTLRLQLCAFSQDVSHSNASVLATTTIGEITGQHFLQDCHYDLVFQPPAAGTWQFALQLSEWNGVSYTLLNTVYFSNPYQVPNTPPQAEDSNAPTELVTLAALEDTSSEVLAETTLEPSPQVAQSNKKQVKKNAIGSVDGYLAINKCKVEKLLKVKGVPKKVLEKIIAERPFHSNKAVLGIKGMGPTMLNRIIESVTR